MKSFFLIIFFLISCSAFSKSVVPTYERITTKNGVPIYFFPSPNIPLFQVELVYERGADLDPDGKSGLALLATAMLKKGIPGFDEKALSQKIDDLAAGIEVSVSEEKTTFLTYGLNLHANSILKLFFEQLSKATFPQEPFQRLKSNLLDNITQLLDSPSGLASHIFSIVLFNGTPKARPNVGFKKDIVQIQIQEAKTFFSELLRTDYLKVLVVGGKDKSELFNLVKSEIENLECVACSKSLPKTQNWNVKNLRISPKAVLLLNTPELQEAHIRVGFLGPKRKIPEFYDLRVAETILSGHFSSRLNQVFRENLNLTYSISADFSFGSKMGSFIVSSSTHSKKVGVFLKKLDNLMQTFQKGELQQEEIQIAKDYLIGSFPLNLQNLYSVAGQFFHGMLNGLEPNFLDIYRERIGKVTLETIKSAIQKHFHWEKQITVVVGNSKNIESQLKKQKIPFVLKNPQDLL